MLIASFDTPVSSGRSLIRTPFSSSTRTTLALIASDKSEMGIEFDGERQQHLGEERRKSGAGSATVSRSGGPRRAIQRSAE